MDLRHAAALGLALVALASLQWGSLAFPSAANIFAPLWLEGAGLAAAAFGLSRGALRGAAGGLAVAAVGQLAFLALFAAGSLGALGAVSSLLTAAGYALAAGGLVRGGALASARAGFAVACASMLLFAALDLASGSTFLLLGYLMAIPGWLLAAGAAFAGAAGPARRGAPA